MRESQAKAFGIEFCATAMRRVHSGMKPTRELAREHSQSVAGDGTPMRFAWDGDPRLRENR